ncbi:MAG: energy transducer TonB [Pyrinomonadaceae bacterium]
MQRGKILRATLCALPLLANGAGPLAQERTRTPPPQGEPQTVVPQPGMRISVMPTQEGGIAAPERTFVFAGQGDAGFSFVSTEMMFDDKVVKGAPFTADAVTESVQTLADGNRITHTSSTRVYRDSEGRTRREQSTGGVGTWTSGEDAPQAIFIHDPVAGTGYILNPKTHTAQKMMQFFFTTRPEGGGMQGVLRSEDKVAVTAANSSSRLPIEGGGLSGKAIKKVQPTYPPVAMAAGAEGEVTVEVVVNEQGTIESAKAISGHPLLQQAAVDAARQWTFSPTTLEGKPVKVKGRISFVFSKEQGHPGADVEATAAAREKMTAERASVERRVQERFPQTHEALGTQTVEGVQAEGTRNTITIPAGSVGNDREIKIVSERWYSPELQTVVMTKHSDPRFGETTYRLTNISRAEPDRSLFELPAGYAVNDRGTFERRVMKREPQNEQ